MERERLARAAQRATAKAETPTPSQPSQREGSPRKRVKLSHAVETASEITSEGSRNGNAEEVDAMKPSTARLAVSTSNDLPKAELQYPHGVIRRTWAASHDRANDVKFEEVVQPKLLRKAALSSFMWDHEWLFSMIDLSKADVLLMVQAKTQRDRDIITQERDETNSRIQLCFPPMLGQVNCMHSKLMLLFYDDYMRVVVPTANLTRYDWGDNGKMENSLFMIDLPEHPPEHVMSAVDLPPFEQELLSFLRSSEAPEHLLKAIVRYDFSKTTQIAFVHSIGGSHVGDPRTRTGYVGLGRAIRQLDLHTDHLELDCATSSIGAIKDEFLKAVYTSLKGNDVGGQPTIDFKSKKSKYLEHMRIFFPTHETVENSFGGTDGAGTISLQRKWYEDPTFPRSLMRDYKSTRPGLLSHNKLMFGRGTRMGGADGTTQLSRAWVYVGSHNLSESAWGRVVHDKGRKEAKINCRNWECGVLMAVPVEDGSLESGSEVPFDVFKGHVDVPFEYPGEAFGEKEPWFFMDPR